MRCIIVISIFLSLNSWAGLILEPTLAFQKGAWKGTRTDTSYEAALQGDTFGYLYGARGLVRIGKVFFGGSYESGKLSWLLKKSETSAVDDIYLDKIGATQTNMSILAGSSAFKGYVALTMGYIFSSEVELDKNFDPSLQAQTYSGRGIRFGMSFRTGKRARLNFEYMKLTYDEMTEGGVTAGLPGTVGANRYSELDLKQLLVYFSFPLGSYSGKGR